MLLRQILNLLDDSPLVVKLFLMCPGEADCFQPNFLSFPLKVFVFIPNGRHVSQLDEPFVLKATYNYFRVKDPSLISSAGRAMLHSDNPSVHGNMWEAILPPVFLESQDNLKRDNQDIPPFYFHAPQVSGPDIIFFVQILRQVLQTTEAEQAPATVGGRTIQGKLNKEQQKQQKKLGSCVESETYQPRQLQDYCTSGVYISMVITYPTGVVRFWVVRPDPEPELCGLTRVSIDVDDNNFAKIFPERHVKFLDQLKKFKRSAEDEQQPDRSKKAKADVYHTYQSHCTLRLLK